MLSYLIAIEYPLELHVQSPIYLQIECECHARDAIGNSILCGIYARYYYIGRLVGRRFAMERIPGDRHQYATQPFAGIPIPTLCCISQ